MCAAEHMTWADAENNGYSVKPNRRRLTTAQVELLTWNFRRFQAVHMTHMLKASP